MLAFPPPCLRCSVLALLGWTRLEAEGSARGATDDVKTPAATTAMVISSANNTTRNYIHLSESVALRHSLECEPAQAFSGKALNLEGAVLKLNFT